AARYGDGCAAFAVDTSSIAVDAPGCEARHALTDLAALVNDSGAVRVEYATLGDVTEVACDDHATLAGLFSEALLEVEGGGMSIAVWDDSGLHDCQSVCDDTSTLEQMLIGAFIRQANGVLRLR